MVLSIKGGNGVRVVKIGDQPVSRTLLKNVRMLVRIDIYLVYCLPVLPQRKRAPGIRPQTHPIQIHLLAWTLWNQTDTKDILFELSALRPQRVQGNIDNRLGGMRRAWTKHPECSFGFHKTLRRKARTDFRIYKPRGESKFMPCGRNWIGQSG